MKIHFYAVHPDKWELSGECYSHLFDPTFLEVVREELGLGSEHQTLIRQTILSASASYELAKQHQNIERTYSPKEQRILQKQFAEATKRFIETYSKLRDSGNAFYNIMFEELEFSSVEDDEEVTVEFSMPNIPALELLQKAAERSSKTSNRFKFRRKKNTKYETWVYHHAPLFDLSSKVNLSYGNFYKSSGKEPHRSMALLKKILQRIEPKVSYQQIADGIESYNSGKNRRVGANQLAEAN